MDTVTSSPAENYVDEDLTFFMGLYRDRTRARGALMRLREHFPDSRVIVRSDGDADPGNHALVDDFGVEYFEEERLFPIENGGAMISRTLELLVGHPSPYLLRIDTDTAIYRRFRYLPEEKGVFGTVQTNKQGCQSIQGGFTGFPLQVAQEILASGILSDPRLRAPKFHWRESLYFARMAQRAFWKGLASFDWIVGWAALELGLPLVSFPEVYCKGLVRNAVANLDLEYAVVHPVYFD